MQVVLIGHSGQLALAGVALAVAPEIAAVPDPTTTSEKLQFPLVQADRLLGLAVVVKTEQVGV